MPLTEQKHSLTWTIEAMQMLMIRWNNKSYWRHPFTADTCGTCKAEVNIATGNAGWFCECGAYNVQDWSGNVVHPFDEPKYGPATAQLREAIEYHETHATGSDEVHGRLCDH